MPLTDEQIKALRDGCEGITPGPWFVLTDRHAYHAAFAYSATVRGGSWESYEDFALVAYEPDAAHIARCDPQTISELCTRVLEAEARVKWLENNLTEAHQKAMDDRDELRARVKVLEEALLTLAKEYSSGAMFNFLGDPEAHPSIRRARKALEEVK